MNALRKKQDTRGAGGGEFPLLAMRGICKRFPGVVALDKVDFSIDAAQVVGLIGENGAGKSTLMNVLGGVYQPDEGKIIFEGQAVSILDVTDSMNHGIAFIHQELNVLGNIDVAGNIFFGREPVVSPFRFISQKKLHLQTEPYLKRLGLDVSSHSLLGDLSLAQKQLVEIARALSLNARLIIMDEPTSSLTLRETERLLEVVLELKSQGVSIIYISHRLSELNQVADCIVGLRDGKNAGELVHDEINHDAMVRMMVGRDVKNFYVQHQAAVTANYFRVKNIRSRIYPQHVVNFEAARGEILGFAGLVGAGRTEMAEAIFGLDGASPSQVWIGEEEVQISNVRQAINHGIYLVPEDRRGAGLITEMSLRENIPLPAQNRYAKSGWILKQRETEVAEQQKKSLQIKTPGVEALVKNLSGGNQQKVVLGKWLSLDPRVIIFDEPTRGIDVGTKAEIYRILRELAKNGVVVLMISSDMEEIIHVSDRVAVMWEGRTTGILDRDQVTEENIMQLAVGKQLESGCAGKQKS